MSCTKCDLHSKCKSVKLNGFYPSGGFDILFVLDNPDRIEDGEGKVIASDIKYLIDYYLEKSGIDKRRIAITHAVKCHTWATSNIKPKHIKACRDHLYYEILVKKPKVIITMGKIALESVTKLKGVSDFRGHWQSIELPYKHNDEIKKLKVDVMPTFCPYIAKKKWEYHDYIIHDLKKAKEGNTSIEPTPKFTTVRSLEDLENFKRVMLSDSTKYIVNDLETTGLDFLTSEIINIGYCTSDNQVFIVPLLSYKNEHTKKWNKEDTNYAKQINMFLLKHRFDAIKAVKEVHASGKPFIYHNGKFDVKFLRKANIPVKNWYFDTMLANPLIDENKFHSLNMVMEWNDINYGAYDTKLWPYVNKGEEKKTYQFIPPRMLEEYLAIDVMGCKKLVPIQISKLKELNLYEYFFKTKMPMAKIMCDVEYNGVKVDIDMILEAGKKIHEELINIQKEADTLTGIENFQLRSNAKILGYMQEMGFPFEKYKIKKNKTGFTVDKNTLGIFSKIKKWHKFPRLLLKYKAYSKLIGTYVTGKDYFVTGEKGGFLKCADSENRVHTTFNTHSTKTGRFGSRGPSLQVFPRPIPGLPNIRNFIRSSSDNHCIVETDFSQLEICVAAVLFKDKTMIDRIRDKADIHTKTAIDLNKTLNFFDKDITYEYFMTAIGKGKFDIDASKIPEDVKVKLDQIRTRTKTIQFGLLYGKGAHTFAQEFDVSFDAAQEMIEAYLNVYKGVKAGRENLIKQAMTKGYVDMYFGRKRRFFPAYNWLKDSRSENVYGIDFLREEISRQALNSPIQGTAHEIYERAIIRCINEIKKNKMEAKLILSIHDSAAFDCPREEQEEMINIINRTFPETFYKGTEYELTLSVDTKTYSSHWYLK